MATSITNETTIESSKLANETASVEDAHLRSPAPEQAVDLLKMPERRPDRTIGPIEETETRRGRPVLRNSDKNLLPSAQRARSSSRPGRRLISVMKRTSSNRRVANADNASQSEASIGGENRSMPEAAAAAAAAELADHRIQPVTNKHRVPFRRIRGLLKGESRRSRRQLKSSQRSDTAEGGPEEEKHEISGDLHSEAPVSVVGSNRDDVSTIYDVTLDERSAATPARAYQSPGGRESAAQDDGKFLLRMVLLLMDTTSRRFELLQLEFDSDRALVSDVLEQVPDSVTVPSLRDRTFDGIITVHGDEKDMNKHLATFCKGNDILVAVPKGLSTRETARLAHQILSNPKIATMLVSSGVDVPVMARHSMANRDIFFPDGADRQAKYEPDLTNKPVRCGGSFLLFAILLAMIGLVGRYFHKFLTMPIQPGHVVSPGVVLSRCGLNFFSDDCSHAYLKVQSGKVLFYKGSELEWVIYGPTCPEDQPLDGHCRNGLEFKNDRTLWLGGEHITWLVERLSETTTNHHNATKATNPFSPWPFSVKPKIKSWEVAADQLESVDAANFVRKNRKKIGTQKSQLNNLTSLELKSRKPQLVCPSGKDSCRLYQSWHRRVEIRRVRRRNPQSTHSYPSWRKLAAESSAVRKETTTSKVK